MQHPFYKSDNYTNKRGFTLIEMAVVLIIVGIVISIVATILPSLIQSARIKKARAILEKVDYAVEGYLTANGRLPYADSDGDGTGDTGTYFGDLPYRDLGLSAGVDAWNNIMKYGVYQDLTTSTPTTFCAILQSAATSAFDSAKLHINQNGALTNMAYVIVSGGPKDLDNSNGFFDGRNGDDNSEFDDPTRITNTTPGSGYDDLMLARSFNEVSGIQGCSGGTGGGGGGGGSSGVENTDELCSDGIDNDNDGYIDCYDQDCCGSGLSVCSQCPPSTNVQLNTSAMANGTAGATYTHTFQATGGSGYYYWYVDSISPAISGLTINLWNGTLSGTIDNCAGDYTVNVRVEDRYDSTKTDSHAFTLTVVNPTLVVTPSPGGGGAGNPDFTVDSTNFSQNFTVTGGQVGSFNWTLNWSGDDPGGFQIIKQSDTEAKLSKTGASTAGNFSFTLTATDSSCTTNTITTNPYTMTITPSGVGAPYSAGLVAEWRMDECEWNGTEGEVKDSGDNALDGTAQGGADTLGSGKICRAGYFDGNDDKIVVAISSPGIEFNNELTLACWFKSPGGGGSYPRLVEFSNSTGSYQYSSAIAYDSDGTLRAWVTNEATGIRGGEIDYSGANYNDNLWHHVVYTYSSSNGGRLYVDGELKQTATDDPVSNITDAETFSIGGYYLDNSNGFKGLIDEVMIFNRELSEDDVTDLYGLSRDTCSGSCYTEPIAEYRMENFPWSGTSGEVVDSGTGESNGIAAARGSGSIPSQTSPSAGKVCRSGVFTRIDANNGGYLDLGDPSDGDLDPGTRPWTISAWIKWDGSSGENIIYNKENLYEARVNAGYVQYAWRPHWAWDGGASFPITADTWTYVTVVYDGHEQILYRNGQAVFTRLQSGAMGANSSKLLIGARGSNSPRNFFGGLIDEVKIYDRPLAENEINEDMNGTRDCASDSVYITSTGLPNGTINSSYSTTLTATGGTAPYGWEIVAPNPISGLSIVPNTGQLHGTINVCAGGYDITIRVTDATGSMDERTFTLTVENGTLSITPASPNTFNCTSSTFYQDFSVSGPRLGALENWTITWLGTNPGGFEIISTGDNTARFRKIGTSSAGSGYLFKITARDSSCTDNQVDSGYYTLNISGEGADQPYYVGMVGEWHLDECSWDGTSGEILDSSGTGAHGESHNMESQDGPERSVGRICHCAALNLDGVLNQYITLGNQAFDNLGDFSLSMWFRIENLSSSITPLFSGARAGAYNNMLIYLNSSGTAFLTWLNNIQTGNFSIGSSVADGLWHHVVWVRQSASGVETIYLDGSPLNDSNAAGNSSSISLDSGGVIIGQEQDSLGGGFDSNQVFHGWIDEVMVYNRTLSQSEVSDLVSLTHSCSGTCYSDPLAEYRMDEASWTSGTQCVSDSVGSYDGTPYGSADIDQTDSHLCYSGDFSNNDSYILITGLPVSTEAGQKVTVCFWMKWAGNYSEMPIGWGSRYDLLFLSNSLGFNTGCSDVFGVSGVGSLANGWHHVAAVFTNNDPDKNQLYIDGVLQPSTLITGAQCSRTVSSAFYISGWDTGTNYKYNGLLDELRIYNRGLSSSEVGQDMNSSHSCPGGP